MAVNRYYYPTQYESRANVVALGVKCIFISHQQKDKDDAKKIADYLLKAGVDVYFDEYDGDLRIHHQSNNPVGITNSIKKGINNSSHMLVIVSPNTLYSTWVPFEVGYGHDKTVLYVLCLKGIQKGGLPEYIKTAKIVRDIYDLNNFTGNILGVDKDFLLKANIIQDFNSNVNPLVNVMDTLISENY